MAGIATAAPSCSKETTARPSCGTHADCAAYGKAARCSGGVCTGPGLTCAERAGLEGTSPSAGEGSETVAAVYDEWLTTAGSLITRWCTQSAMCSTSPGGSAACIETAPDPAAVSCCKKALDYYHSHRQQIQDCASATASCDAPGFDAFCAPAETLLDAICEQG